MISTYHYCFNITVHIKCLTRSSIISLPHLYLGKIIIIEHFIVSILDSFWRYSPQNQSKITKAWSLRPFSIILIFSKTPLVYFLKKHESIFSYYLVLKELFLVIFVKEVSHRSGKGKQFNVSLTLFDVSILRSPITFISSNLFVIWFSWLLNLLKKKKLHINFHWYF